MENLKKCLVEFAELEGGELFEKTTGFLGGDIREIEVCINTQVGMVRFLFKERRSFTMASSNKSQSTKIVSKFKRSKKVSLSIKRRVSLIASLIGSQPFKVSSNSKIIYDTLTENKEVLRVMEALNCTSIEVQGVKNGNNYVLVAYIDGIFCQPDVLGQGLDIFTMLLKILGEEPYI